MRKVGVGDLRLGAGDKLGIDDVFASHQISPGPQVALFENVFAKRHGCDYGVMTNSGTDALRIALAALKEMHGWKDGDQILVPSVTFVATVNVVLQLNLKPIPVDVGLDGNINPARIQHHFACTPEPERTKGLIVAHLFGRPADMGQVMGYASEHGLKVIEDSCETVGVSVNGKPVGSWGEAGCFSFYIAHILTTGVGGMATTKDPALEKLMRSYANHGRDPAYIPGHNNSPLTKEFLQKRFRFERLGYSCRPTEFEAAIGLSQLTKLDQLIAKRRHNARQLVERLSDLPLVLPDEKGSAFMMFPILLRESCRVDKWDLCLHLEERGIETREMMPLSQPCYQGLFDISGFYMSGEIAKRGFYIGCHPYMTQDDHNAVWEAFHDFNWKP